MVNVWGGECLGGERLTIERNTISNEICLGFSRKYGGLQGYLEGLVNLLRGVGERGKGSSILGR